MDKNPRIAVRIDDICPWSDAAEVERVISKVESHGITGLLGVVPCCEDPDLLVAGENPDFWEWLRALRDGGWSLALHGYKHVYNNVARGLMSRMPKNTEFAGNPYGVQLDAIRRGREVLASHELDTDVFFAPAHSFDVNTLRALRAAGFACVSDGRSRYSYVREGIKHVPCRSYGLPKRPQGMVTLAMHPCEPKPVEPWLNYIDRWAECLVSWSELAAEPVRHNAMRMVDEMAYLLWQEGIKPPLRKVRDVVAGRRANRS